MAGRWPGGGREVAGRWPVDFESVPVSKSNPFVHEQQLQIFINTGAAYCHAIKNKIKNHAVDKVKK